MSRGSNKCAACGQFAGRGHRCATPAAVTPNETASRTGTRARKDSPPPVADRVARAQQAIREMDAQAPGRQAVLESLPLDGNGNPQRITEHGWMSDQEVKERFGERAYLSPSLKDSSGRFRNGPASTMAADHPFEIKYHPTRTQRVLSRFSRPQQQGFIGSGGRGMTVASMERQGII